METSEIIGSEELLLLPTDRDPASAEKAKLKDTVKISLIFHKFDKRWEHKAEIFCSYFVCKECDMVKKLKKDLKIHSGLCERRNKTYYYVDTATIEFKCAICERSCRTAQQLELHQRNLHSQEYECDYCSQTCSNKHVLLHHILNHFNKSCPICGKEISKGKMERHLGTAIHNPRPAKCTCDLCGRRLTKDSLRYHFKNRHSNGKYFCHFGCSQKFIKLRDMLDHYTVHIAPGQWKCPDCEYTAKQLNGFIRHLQSTRMRMQYNCPRYIKNLKAKKIAEKKKSKKLKT